MKKTTWVIIGLSVCVVVLAAALGVVLTQKKTEIIIIREPEIHLYKPIDFRIAQPGFEKTKHYYYMMPVTVPEFGKKVDFLGEKIPGFPGKVMFLKRTNKK